VSARARWAVVALALGAAGAAVVSGSSARAAGALRELAKWVAGRPAWLGRAATRSGEPPLSRVAASQVGYSPSMRKRFTAPRRFGGFRVVREGDGSAAFTGGPPVREVRTGLLGDARTVWIGDFTPLAAEGRYRIVLDDGLASFPFDVRADPFAPAIRAVQRALYFQRAFTAIDAAHAEGPWTHPSDAHLAPQGERKGWHDAGDYSVYNASTASALFWLLEAYADFQPTADDTDIPESGNGVPDLLDEARWALEWMLSVEEPSGGFRNATCQERYGRYGTNRPEAMPPYRSGEVGTLATARAVGTLAFASHLYRAFDAAFAARCLEAARRGWEYLERHPGESTDGPTCPAFRQDGDGRAGRDVRMYAAAGMLLVTGDPRFRDAFEASFQELSNDPSAYRFNVYAALLYLRAPAGVADRKRSIRVSLLERAAEARADGAAHPFEWASRYHWGSIAAGFHRAAFGAKACLRDPAGASPDCEQALASVHYALGRNSLQLCYVSGLPGVSRGRSHAFHQWLAALRATPFAFPGLVAGGPQEAPVETDVSFPHARPAPVWGYFGDPAMPRDARTPIDARYTDNDSWSANELDVDWQAVALYQLYFARWWASRGPR
jgi:endoglucanase